MPAGGRKKNKLQSIHLISAKNMRTGQERRRKREKETEELRVYWKELQGLFVMTKLDAKTVIKGDGKQWKYKMGMDKGSSGEKRLGLKMLIISEMRLTGRRNVTAEWSGCWG